MSSTSAPTADAPASALAICGIRKRYGQLEALRGISFEIRRGEFFALLGPNGAGTSKLPSILSGLIHASEGTVSVLGHATVRDFRAARRLPGGGPPAVVCDR